MSDAGSIGTACKSPVIKVGTSTTPHEVSWNVGGQVKRRSFDVPENLDVRATGYLVSDFLKFKSGLDVMSELRSDATFKLSYMGVTLSPDASYTSANQLHQNRMYAFYTYDQGAYTVTLNGLDPDKWLDPGFAKRVINELRPWSETDPDVVADYKEFFDQMGTHIVGAATYGWRAQISSSTQQQNNLGANEFAASLFTQFQGIMATTVQSPTAKVDHASDWEKYVDVSSTHVRVVGGDTSAIYPILNSLRTSALKSALPPSQAKLKDGQPASMSPSTNPTAPAIPPIPAAPAIPESPTESQTSAAYGRWLASIGRQGTEDVANVQLNAIWEILEGSEDPALRKKATHLRNAYRYIAVYDEAASMRRVPCVLEMLADWGQVDFTLSDPAIQILLPDGDSPATVSGGDRTLTLGTLPNDGEPSTKKVAQQSLSFILLVPAATTHVTFTTKHGEKGKSSFLHLNDEEPYIYFSFYGADGKPLDRSPYRNWLQNGGTNDQTWTANLV